MATGYKTVTPGGTFSFSHVNNDHTFYSSDLGRWLMIVDDGAQPDDWYLYENDEATPGAPGGTGGWSAAPLNGGGIVHIDPQDSAKLGCFWDNVRRELHVLRRKNAANGRYSKWTLNMPAGDWTETIANEDIGFNFSNEGKRASIVADSNGLPWIVYDDADQLKARSRSGGTWAVGNVVTIEATASTSANNVRPAIVRWQRTTGTPGIVCAYPYGEAGGNKWKIAYRDDSAGATAAWTIENADTTITNIDDQCSIRAVELGTDTTSTLTVVVKDNSDDVHMFKRNAAGSWSKHANIVTTRTRPVQIVDETGEKISILVPAPGISGQTRIDRYVSPIGAVAFAPAEKVLEDDGVNTFVSDLGVPAHNVTSDMDMLVLGRSGAVWWNILDVPAAGGATLAERGIGRGIMRGVDRGM